VSAQKLQLGYLPNYIGGLIPKLSKSAFAKF